MYRTGYLLAASWTLLVMGGCGGGQVLDVREPVDFQHQVVESQVPVVVEMYKGG